VIVKNCVFLRHAKVSALKVGGEVDLLLAFGGEASETTIDQAA